MTDRDALVQFLRGDLPFARLASQLGRKVRFDFKNDSRSVRMRGDLGFTIPVRPADLRPMLLRYVVGTCTADTISTWASVIVHVPAYERPGKTPAAELLWELLTALAAPPANVNVTPRNVARLLAKLPSIESELARSA